MSQEAEQNTDKPTDDTIMSMSDDDIGNLDLSFLDEEAPENEIVELEEDSSDTNTNEVLSEQEDSEESEEPSDPEGLHESEEDDDDELEDDDSQEDDEEASEDEVEDDPEESSEEAKEEEKEEDSEDTDYKAKYEEVFKPFKANGKTMQVDSVDEVRQLMQMGANYNKKMAALKPSLKTLKLLERNEMLDDGKLSYLIDLSNKNPEAIKKLVKESGIDPMDIDVDAESEYQPQTYTVDDREIALDEVLDDIQDTPTYSNTINLFSNKWDGQSKRVVAENPELLKVINDHMGSGIYDRIADEVDKQRTFGRLSGLSDIEAYRTVGDELDAKGAFNDLVAQPDQQKAPQQKTVVKTPKKQDSKLARKKRAASSTRKAPAKRKSADDYNPLSISDEEFERMVNEKLM